MYLSHFHVIRTLATHGIFASLVLHHLHRTSGPILPSFSPKYLAGALWGFLYSLPGAVFTAVPYPLTADAPAYYREFAGGGLRAALLTLLFGALAGGIAGLFHRSRA